jgi:hypothetical protein
MKVQIVSGGTTFTVGVVEGLDINLGYEGGAEPYYGSRVRKHSAGSKTASFTLTRWFYAGNAIANTTVTITDCRLYRWRPRTGGADDIIGEEAQGQGTDWTIDVEPTS